jgi:hypothetical protein
MIDSKFFITLVGLIAAIFVICRINFTKSSNVHENFLMYPLTTNLQAMNGQHAHTNSTAALLESKKGRKIYKCSHEKEGLVKKESYGNKMGNEYMLEEQSGGSTVSAAKKAPFHHYPSYQANLSPRTNLAEGYSSIHRGMPQENFRAVSSSGPLFKDLASENYCGSCSGGSCSEPKLYEEEPINEGFTGPTGPPGPGSNQGTVASNDIISTIPLGDMTQYSNDGSDKQVYTHAIMMASSRNNRLRRHGDPIRGDLPIVPCNNGWFSTNPKPEEDLHQGAMNVLSGVDNEVSNNMSSLHFALNGKTTVGGVDIADHLHNSLSDGEQVYTVH